MIKKHKEFVKWFQTKTGVSDYTLLWISFTEGFIIGGLIIYYIN